MRGLLAAGMRGSATRADGGVGTGAGAGGGGGRSGGAGAGADGTGSRGAPAGSGLAATVHDATFACAEACTALVQKLKTFQEGRAEDQAAFLRLRTAALTQIFAARLAPLDNTLLAHLAHLERVEAEWGELLNSGRT